MGTDRNAHFKIVAVALISAVVLVVVGLTARMDGYETANADIPVLKVSKPTTVTTRNGSTIR